MTLKEGELNEYGLPHNPRAHGYIAQGFPAPGLRRTVRHITGHTADGKATFLSTDCGDHHLIMGEEQALSNIIYSTHQTPVNINDDADVKHAKENVVSSAGRSMLLRVRRSSSLMLSDL
jgi:hypothetical protein